MANNGVVFINLILELTCIFLTGTPLVYDDFKTYGRIENVILFSAICVFFLVSIAWYFYVRQSQAPTVMPARAVRLLQSLVLLAIGALLIYFATDWETAESCDYYDSSFFGACQRFILKVVAGGLLIINAIFYVIPPHRKPLKHEINAPQSPQAPGGFWQLPRARVQSFREKLRRHDSFRPEAQDHRSPSPVVPPVPPPKPIGSPMFQARFVDGVPSGGGHQGRYDNDVHTSHRMYERNFSRQDSTRASSTNFSRSDPNRASSNPNFSRHRPQDQSNHYASNKVTFSNKVHVLPPLPGQGPRSAPPPVSSPPPPPPPPAPGAPLSPPPGGPQQQQKKGQMSSTPVIPPQDYNGDVFFGTASSMRSVHNIPPSKLFYRENPMGSPGPQSPSSNGSQFGEVNFGYQQEPDADYGFEPQSAAFNPHVMRYGSPQQQRSYDPNFEY